MSAFDLGILVFTLLGLVALAAWLAGRQRSTTDSNLGGPNLPARTLGSSLAGNRESTIFVLLVGVSALVD